MGAVIRTLWIGPELSLLEQLCLSSFLAHGHEVCLYLYEDVRGVPPGTILEDAARVLPASSIFTYTATPSYAGFSNFFRYKLLLEHGGWWVDTDVVCLRPFRFDREHVFAAEHGSDGPIATSGILKAPAGSAFMARAWEVCRGKDPAKLRWGETGPRLVDALVAEMGLGDCVEPADVFCPLDYRSWRDVLDPSRARSFPESTRAVHLWNEMWRENGLDKNARYDDGCLFERLKRRYLG